MSRKIVESPISVGEDEIVPYRLTIPSSWGTASSPTAVVEDSNGSAVSGAISGTPSIASNVLSFTVDATQLTVDTDYRLELKFSVTGGTLEAYADLQVRD